MNSMSTELVADEDIASSLMSSLGSLHHLSRPYDYSAVVPFWRMKDGIRRSIEAGCTIGVMVKDEVMARILQNIPSMECFTERNGNELCTIRCAGNGLDGHAGLVVKTNQMIEGWGMGICMCSGDEQRPRIITLDPHEIEGLIVLN